MVKKTKFKRGGKTFLEKTLGKVYEGSMVADNISDNIRRKKGTQLLDEYKLRKDIAQLDYDIAQGRKDHSDDLNEKLKDRNFKYDKLNSSNFNYRLRLFGDVLNAFWRFIGFIFSKIQFVFDKLPVYLSFFRDTLILLLNLIRGFIGVGQGALVKVLILIMIFVGIAMGISNALGSSSNPAIDKKTSLNEFTTTPTPSIGSYLNSTIKSFIPDSFTREMNNINSRINNIFGNDIKANSVNRIKRDEITDGRYNGTTNVRIKDDNNKIHSIIKPKPYLNIPVGDLNSYPNIDYNKLPDFIKKDLISSSNSKYSDNIKFELKTKIKDKNEYYIYKVVGSGTNILENDKNEINKFNVKSGEPDIIKIKDKEKHLYMFDVKDDKFVYPENIGTKLFNG